MAQVQRFCPEDSWEVFQRLLGAGRRARGLPSVGLCFALSGALGVHVIFIVQGDPLGSRGD